MASRQAFMGYQGMMLNPARQVRLAGTGRVRTRLAGTGQPPPAGLNCQATQDGGMICSDGTPFPPGCPKMPNANYPGVAQYRQEGNLLYPIPPPPPGGAAAAPVSPAPSAQPSGAFPGGSCPYQPPAAGAPAAPAGQQYPSGAPSYVTPGAPIPAPPPPPAMSSADSDVGSLVAVGGLGALVYFLLG